MKPLTYPSWALTTFSEHIAPVFVKIAKGYRFVENSWLDSCTPGTTEVTRFRLFPGSLYLLWLQALGGTISEDHTKVATALECIHNASLHHDDALDSHNSRRGVNTIRSYVGESGSILAGDGLLGVALSILATIKHLDNQNIIRMFGEKWLQMNYGQFLDEPFVWNKVSIEKYEKHWEIMTINKLAIGNAAAPLAAISENRKDISESLLKIHEDFSIVSQILNDIGDFEGWAGFHVIGHCKRELGHETRKKPNIASIWSRDIALSNQKHSNNRYLLIERANKKIVDCGNMALQRLEMLDLSNPYDEVLRDFFNRPLAEFERITKRRSEG